MKQIVSALIKLLGFYFLISALHSLTYNAYVFKYDPKMLWYFGFATLFNLGLFYVFAFKTQQIFNLFRIKWESEESLAYPVILKAGIFLIGFYLLSNFVGNVLGEVLYWLKQELSSTGSYSVDNLVDDLLNVFNPHSFIVSLFNSLVGFFIAYKHVAIADYFMKADQPNKAVEDIEE